MYVFGERACHDESPPRLDDVALKCGNCGTGATTISLLLQEARRCGFEDPDQGLGQGSP
jgi:hypothetical protein